MDEPSTFIVWQAKRLVSVLHGPVVGHVLDSLQGREYIRSFGQVDHFVQHALQLLEASTQAQYFNIAL